MVQNFPKKGQTIHKSNIDIVSNKKGKNYKTVSFELLRVVYDSNEFFFRFNCLFTEKN
jgi:hypothetical protein